MRCRSNPMTGRSHAIASAAAAAAAAHTQTIEFARMVANCSPATAASLVKLRVPHFDLVHCDRIRILPQHLKRNKACTPYALVKRSKLLIYYCEVPNLYIPHILCSYSTLWVSGSVFNNWCCGWVLNTKTIFCSGLLLGLYDYMAFTTENRYAHTLPYSIMHALSIL